MKKLVTVLFFTGSLFLGYSQVGIGTTVPDAALDITSTNDGILIPRVALTSTATSTPLVTPNASEMIYNTATIADVTPGYYYWEVFPNVPIDRWVRLAESTNNDWSLIGNLATSPGTWAAPGTNYIGTSDLLPFFIRTNNVNRMSFGTNGNVFIGNAPTTDNSKLYNENSATDVNNLYGFQNNFKSNLGGATASYGINNVNDNTNPLYTGAKQGILNTITPSGTGFKIGMTNSISDNPVAGGFVRGVSNLFTINGSTSGNVNSGLTNIITYSATGRGSFRGFHNFITTNAAGTHNEMIAGLYNDFAIRTNGTTYGSYTTFVSSAPAATGPKYGSYVAISPSLGGTHYGCYADVAGVGNYAGYFLGNVTIKHDVANNGVFYIDNASSSGFAGAYFSEGAFSVANYRGHIGHVNSSSTFAQPGTFQLASGNRDMLFGATNGANTFTERMRINNDTGFVGINTNPTNVNGDLTPATSTLHVNGSIAVGVVKVSLAAGATYVVANDVSKLIVEPTTNAGTCTITLPDPTTCKGRLISIAYGNANTARAISLDPAGAALNIQHFTGVMANTTTVPTTFGTFILWSDGVNWYR